MYVYCFSIFIINNKLHTVRYFEWGGTMIRHSAQLMAQPCYFLCVYLNLTSPENKYALIIDGVRFVVHIHPTIPVMNIYRWSAVSWRLDVGKKYAVSCYCISLLNAISNKSFGEVKIRFSVNTLRPGYACMQLWNELPLAHPAITWTYTDPLFPRTNTIYTPNATLLFHETASFSWYGTHNPCYVSFNMLKRFHVVVLL